MRIGWVMALLLVACDGTAAPDAGPSGNDAGARDAGGFDGGAVDAGVDAGGVMDAGGAPDAGVDAGPPGPSLDDRIAALEDPSADADALDALIDAVTWAEGWPVTDGSRWLFATRWDEPGGAVGLVSDVNDGTPAAATVAASGVHYWVVLDEADFAAPAAGALYKWHAGPDTFRAPPEARAYGFDSFGEFGYVAPPTDARWRERFAGFASAHLGPRRAFRAYLPAGFRRGDAARVLLMHDGQNVFHPDAFFGGWRVDEAIAAPGYEDVVILAIDNAPDRFEAYTHVPDAISGGTVGGRADDYARLVFEEALPFFRTHYGLRAAREDLVMAGSSLGGLVSLYLAMTHETEMRCVIAMSSTLGWGAFDPALDGSDALVNRWSAHGSVALYLDHGGEGTCRDTDGDGVEEESDDFDNYCTNLQLRDRLLDLGYTADVDLFHWHEAGAMHNELAWAARMPMALEACVSAGWTP